MFLPPALQGLHSVADGQGDVVRSQLLPEPGPVRSSTLRIGPFTSASIKRTLRSRYLRTMPLRACAALLSRSLMAELHRA